MLTSTAHNWLPERRDDVIFKIVAFFISPVLGLFASLVRLNTRTSFAILFLSLTFIGLTFTVPEERTEELNFDSITYREDFEAFSDDSYVNFNSIISSFANFTGGTDVYSTLLFFTVSRFTANYHILFMFIAIIFSFFMLLCLRHLVSEENYTLSVLCFLLLFLFTICQIQQINAFRFYTAYWIALFALFKIIQENNKKYWILLLITPFVHASFFVIFPIIALYYVLRRSNKLAVVVVLLSLVFSAVAVPIFSWITLHLPENLGGHYGSYLNEWYMQEINSGGSGYKWVVRLLELAVRLSVNIAFLFLANKYAKYLADTKCKNLYFFAMAMLAFVNFTFKIPSVGSRYVMFLFPLLAYIWLVCFAPKKRWNWLMYAFSGMYLLFFLILPWNIYQIPCLRYYFLLWNFDVLIGSPLYLFYKYVILL